MVGRKGKKGREVERRKRGTDHTLQVRKKERWREGREDESIGNLRVRKVER